MMTDFMTLNSRTDASIWANNILGSHVEYAETEPLADWIWDNKPEIGCRYPEHPISSIDTEKFWEILGY